MSYDRDRFDRVITIVSSMIYVSLIGLALLFFIFSAGWMFTGIVLAVLLAVLFAILAAVAHSDRAIEKGKKPNPALFLFYYISALAGEPWPASSYIKGFALLMFLFLCIIIAMVVLDDSKQKPTPSKAMDGKVLNFPD